MGRILDLFGESIKLAAEGVKESVKIASDKLNEVREKIKQDAMAAEEDCCAGCSTGDVEFDEMGDKINDSFDAVDASLDPNESDDCIGECADDSDGPGLVERGREYAAMPDFVEDSHKSSVAIMSDGLKQIKQFMREHNIRAIKFDEVTDGTVLDL